MAEADWLEVLRGRGAILRDDLVAEAPEILADHSWNQYELLSTERALADAPGFADAAARIHLVPADQVPEASAAIVDEVGSDRLVALGGGRVIDSAKAIAAVRGGEVAAIPTTLSGAPMTAIHRLPAGREATAGVRPSLVLADPDAMTSAPEPQLRATAMNALAHGAESLYTPLATEDSRAAALEGARLIALSLDTAPDQRDNTELALGALLCAHAVDQAGIALHHVLGQTSVRVLATPHAETYAALLPFTMDAMRERAPEQLQALAAALGTDSAGIRERIAELGGAPKLGELGADRAKFDEVLDVAMARPDLAHMTPGEVTREQLEAILDSAW